jgi:hypothetical protein
MLHTLLKVCQTPDSSTRMLTEYGAYKGRSGFWRAFKLLGGKGLRLSH